MPLATSLQHLLGDVLGDVANCINFFHGGHRAAAEMAWGETSSRGAR